MRKAHTRDDLRALPRFAELVDGRHRIVSQPPVVVPLREFGGLWGLSTDEIRQAIDKQFSAYKATLTPSRRRGSWTGSRSSTWPARLSVSAVSGPGRSWCCWRAEDTGDPLFLQVKEATSSVLENQLPRSGRDPGQRVVEGQRMMQAASDIFLGWTTGIQADRYYYWRQLRDMKTSAVVETMRPVGMTFYGRICGWTLARAHARSGDPIAIAEYLRDGKNFDRALVDFSAPVRRPERTGLRELRQCRGESGRIEAVQGV